MVGRFERSEEIQVSASAFAIGAVMRACADTWISSLLSKRPTTAARGWYRPVQLLSVAFKAGGLIRLFGTNPLVTRRVYDSSIDDLLGLRVGSL